MPTRVLHLLPTLEGADAVRRVAMLCEQLPRDEFEQHAAAFRLTGAAEPRLREHAAGVYDLRRRFRRDLFTWLALRRLVRSLDVDVVHAWGDDAAAYAAGCGRRVVTSDHGPLPRLVARRTTSFVVPLDAAPVRPVADPGRSALGLPTGVRLIGAAAPLVPASGLKDLIWAIDLVRVMAPDVWLVIVGEGPQRESLGDFSRLACEENRTVLLGDRDDLTDLLPHFDLWWQGGRPAEPPYSLLEAQAAGLPVIADRCEGVSLAIEDGVTGAIVPPADRAARAKATLNLLEDDLARRRMPAAAAGRVAAFASADRLRDACVRHYCRHGQVNAARQAR